MQNFLHFRRNFAIFTNSRKDINSDQSIILHKLEVKNYATIIIFYESVQDAGEKQLR